MRKVEKHPIWDYATALMFTVSIGFTVVAFSVPELFKPESASASPVSHEKPCDTSEQGA